MSEDNMYEKIGKMDGKLDMLLLAHTDFRAELKKEFDTTNTRVTVLEAFQNRSLGILSTVGVLCSVVGGFISAWIKAIAGSH